MNKPTSRSIVQNSNARREAVKGVSFVAAAGFLAVALIGTHPTMANAEAAADSWNEIRIEVPVPGFLKQPQRLA